MGKSKTFLEKSKQYLKRHPKKLLFVSLLLVGYYFCLPGQLFSKPTATIVESADGTLLGGKIAADGQWRFPVADSLPYKFKTCLLEFEDAYFYRHPGFNPIAMAKALGANIRAGKTVRGGSTITQQVIRLSRNNKKRSYLEKTIELVLATRLEWRHSKEKILNLYAGNAPYGGNVVGLEVAAWRYFGLRPHQLSWAEAATLAVLPNAPGLIYPGKNQELLLKKRNRLLRKIYHKDLMDSTSYALALLEELPQKPYPLPKTAPHMVELVSKGHQGQRLRTSLDIDLQRNLNTLVDKHHKTLKQNQVHNAAVLVLDVHTRMVLGYVGNTRTTSEHQKDVDMVMANRSTGSVLKPLLYAAMLDGGELLPDMLVPDVPTQIAGYTPENFDQRYSGAVKAKKALARSLNIPAVRLLQSYGLQKFRDQLTPFGLKGINKSAEHYGLTLILGGAESSLWDLGKTYASLAATINHFNATSSEYYTGEFREPVLMADSTANFGKRSTQKTIFDAGSTYLAFEAMKEVNRPEGNEAWEFFDSSKEIAWKTGTSFGNKDAWAIGVTRDFVVGVWVGNADGEGRPNVSGVNSAAPLLFDVFNLLPRSDWFTRPLDEFTEVTVCAQSGYLARESCPKKRSDIPNKPNAVGSCPYHHWVHLDAQQRFRVNSSCEDLSRVLRVPWFTLPPLLEFYYRGSDPTYKRLPPYRADCSPVTAPVMEFIYPKDGSRIGLTKNFEGKKNELVLKLAHTRTGTMVFWYLNDTFLKQTTEFHEIAVLPPSGRHKVTAVDALGNEVVITITIE